MRVGVGKTDPKEFRCCLCLHVRAGTLVYGLYFLISQLVVFFCLTAVTTRPELAKEWQAFLKQEVSNEQGLNASNVIDLEKTFIEQSRYLWLVTLIAIVCSCLLLYGTITGRASYLLPFLVLRIFDFFIACLLIIGSFAYIVDVQNWVRGWPDYPYIRDVKDYFLTLSPDALMLIFVTLFVAYLMVKAYLLAMVWNTHKYLNQLEMERRDGRATVRHLDMEFMDSDEEALLPPKYEDAIKVMSEQPPPPYTTS